MKKNTVTDTTDTLRLRFHGGNPKHRSPNPHPDAPSQPEPYFAAPELVQAVNLALFLKRPLLLEGEAGCGKTRLAYAVAYELGWPLHRWNIRTTSKAQDGLYSYDALLRLHDVQLQRMESNTSRDPGNAIAYRTLGPLGQAFQQKDWPAVVLIDEIDKADIDFPNDLLSVLDEPWSFDIPETGEKITATDIPETGEKITATDIPETGEKITATDNKPLVIITSNGEKSLPLPFLRRCLYHYVEFPKEDSFNQIVNAHYPDLQEGRPSKNLEEAAITRFFEIRSFTPLQKKPSTSEFLDWLKVLNSFQLSSYDPSLVSKDRVPYPELLFKMRADWVRYAT